VLGAFAQQPLAWAMALGVLGLLVGSFLNVLIHRLPKMLEREWQAHCAEMRGEAVPEQEAFNLLVPRSRCPHCAHAIAWYENIPLLSYALQRGRCRACGGRIASRYPLVEAVSGLLAAYAAWHFGPTWQAVFAVLLLWSLLALTCIDFETFLLPDAMTQPLLWLGLLVNSQGVFVSLESAVIGAAAGYLSLWLVYHLFRLLTGKEGMGFGDFKLLAALGAWLGWTLLPLIIVASSLVGALVGVGLILFAGHQRAKPIPFGPYLAMGGVIALFWGQDLLRAYLMA
jgi:leader peptidase (prepilin peptidase) / N-methyltransferase